MENKITLTTPPYEYKFDEAIKTLRTNLMFSGPNIRSIMFTSTKSSEGKSEIVFSLAMSLAQMGKKVLLLDADIRRSVLMNRYHVNKQTKGLSEYLTGQAEEKDIIYETNVDNLFIIFAGAVAPNPSELLEEEQFRNLIEGAKEIFDYVIVDTPPVGTIIDGAIVGKYCDGAALVIESGAISYHALQKVKSQMERSGARLLGVVLNKVDVNKGGYYGSYYGSYYGEK